MRLNVNVVVPQARSIAHPFLISVRPESALLIASEITAQRCQAFCISIETPRIFWCWSQHCAYVRESPSSCKQKGSPPISKLPLAASEPPLRVLSALKRSTKSAIFESRRIRAASASRYKGHVCGCASEKPYDARPRSATGSQTGAQRLSNARERALGSSFLSACLTSAALLLAHHTVF